VVTRRRAIALVFVLALAAVATGGCGGNDDTSTAGDSLAGKLQVFAAASLTEAFTALGKSFESEHPGVKVEFNFGASSALARQIDQGAPADVFASADEANMAAVTDAGDAADPKPFARNRLAILVEKGNPKKIAGLADTARPGVVLVLCAPQVPCGRYAAAAYAKAGVTPKPASLEDNVKGVVAKVTLGEADAGIVYVTDARAAGENAATVAVDNADSPDLEAVYPIAVTSHAKNPAARAWVDFVLSRAGQRALGSFGFLAP
jgi:molybdate transport system substrate-binding protein